MYVIKTRRAIKVKNFDSKRVRAHCYNLVVGYGKGKHADEEGNSKHTKWQNIPYSLNHDKPICPRFIHVSKVGDEVSWSVKTLKDEHKCIQTRDIYVETSRFLSIEINISKSKAFRAKEIAMKQMLGDHEEQHVMLSKTDIVILVMMISLEGSLHMLSMEGLQGRIGFWFNNGCMDDSRKALRVIDILKEKNKLQRHEALCIWLDMSIISVVAAHSGYE
ncbi:hypothetical protein Tco_0441248 [Tanacetum coccineum]